MSRKARALRMRELVAKYHQSEDSLSQFARTHGISRSKLNYWVRQFQELPQAKGEEAAPGFLPIGLSDKSDPGASYIIINKPCGTQIKIPL